MKDIGWLHTCADEQGSHRFREGWPDERRMEKQWTICVVEEGVEAPRQTADGWRLDPSLPGLPG